MWPTSLTMCLLTAFLVVILTIILIIFKVAPSVSDDNDNNTEAQQPTEASLLLDDNTDSITETTIKKPVKATLSLCDNKDNIAETIAQQPAEANLYLDDNTGSIAATTLHKPAKDILQTNNDDFAETLFWNFNKVSLYLDDHEDKYLKRSLIKTAAIAYVDNTKTVTEIDRVTLCVKHIHDALDTCERIAYKLKNYSFDAVSKKDPFADDTISLIRAAAVKVEKNRKKKNFGVIGGSVAGLLGGAMSITGAALVPFTFGASIGLLISGAAVGTAGAGTSIGFSVDKFIGDRNRFKSVQPSLEKVVEFQLNLVKTAIYIQAVRKLIKLTRNLLQQGEIEICFDALQKIQTFENGQATQTVDMEIGNDQGKQTELNVDQLTQPGLDIVIDHFSQEIDIRNVVLYARKRAEKLYLHITELLNPSRNRFLDNNDADAWYEEKVKEINETKFEDLLSTINMEPAEEDKSETLYSFIVACYIENNSPLKSEGAGVTGARAAAEVVDLSGNVLRIGGTVARVAKGVHAAGIVLGVFSIILDVLFIGHAICDLKDNEKEKFTRALIEVADSMEEINSIFANVCNSQKK